MRNLEQFNSLTSVRDTLVLFHGDACPECTKAVRSRTHTPLIQTPQGRAARPRQSTKTQQRYVGTPSQSRRLKVVSPVCEWQAEAFVAARANLTNVSFATIDCEEPASKLVRVASPLQKCSLLTTASSQVPSGECSIYWRQRMRWELAVQCAKSTRPTQCFSGVRRAAGNSVPGRPCVPWLAGRVRQDGGPSQGLR